VIIRVFKLRAVAVVAARPMAAANAVVREKTDTDMTRYLFAGESAAPLSATGACVLLPVVDTLRPATSPNMTPHENVTEAAAIARMADRRSPKVPTGDAGLEGDLVAARVGMRGSTKPCARMRCPVRSTRG
jgi:hypothetical protein